jgi:hypothetical protein
MNSVKLDNELRKLGYCLVKGRRGESRWQVISQRTHNGYDCDTIKEAASLLLALREQDENGGVLIHDGVDWVCVER